MSKTVRVACSLLWVGLSVYVANVNAQAFGAPLKCTASMPTSVYEVAAKLQDLAPSNDDARWVGEQMSRIGFAATMPEVQEQRSRALAAAALLRRGDIVAAKMVNDEATKSFLGYGKHPYSTSFEALVTALTQPVAHASFPSSVRAKDEVWPEKVDHRYTHGVDMEMASAGLAEIIGRVGSAQKALGAVYKLPPVRFYILASAFRDPVALTAASGSVCQLNLSKDDKTKLDISARFVALPSKYAAQGSMK